MIFSYFSAAKTKSKVVPDEGNIMMLTDMAFTRDQAIKALKETDNNVERAVDWIFNHPNDMGGDVEEEAGTSKYIFTVWKSQDFSVVQILREINFSESTGCSIYYLPEEMAVALKWCIFHPILVKPKCV